jgi:hypothetical protein
MAGGPVGILNARPQTHDGILDRAAASVFNGILAPARWTEGVMNGSQGFYDANGNVTPEAAGQSLMAAMAGSTGGLMTAPEAGGMIVRAGAGRPAPLPSSASLALPGAPTAAQMARAGRIERVPLAAVRGTQPKMDWDKFQRGDHPGDIVQGYGDKPVAVRREDGEYLIFDGHHRAAKAINDGEKHMDMHVIDAKDYAPHLAGRKPAPDGMTADEIMAALFGNDRT